MILKNAEVILDAKAALGEGAIWDTQKKVLYWVDILNKQVRQYNPVTGQHSSINVGQYVGTVVPTKEGALMLGLKNGLAKLDTDTGNISFISNPESHIPNNRFNDGKCDPAGRFWVGSISLTEEDGAGNLYCLDTDYTVKKLIEGVTVSNGLVWTSDKKTFYYIDSPTLQVAAYDYDVTTGNISNRRIAVTIPKKEGFPDGMTIDEEDMLWIAHYSGWQVCRWNPITGEKLLAIKLPVSQPTSCAFGGENLDQLFITSARKELDEAQLKEQPLAGALFCSYNLGVKGVPSYTFGA